MDRESGAGRKRKSPQVSDARFFQSRFQQIHGRVVRSHSSLFFSLLCLDIFVKMLRGEISVSSHRHDLGSHGMKKVLAEIKKTT